MKKLLAAVFIVVLPIISLAEDKPANNDIFWQSRSWTRGEIAWAGSYVLASTLDAIQTSKIDDIYGASEGNPLLRNDDGSPNMTRVVAVKTVVALGLFYLTDHFPHEDRRILLALTNAIQWGVVIWNESITGGILFKW